jgi:hypothetical protein
VLKHRRLIRALELNGVDIIYGKFKMRDKKCRSCGAVYKIPEEKQTDVNIAIYTSDAGIRRVAGLIKQPPTSQCH